ncbi:unnamed protein product, partial [Ectocarpus fasciculatus]
GRKRCPSSTTTRAGTSWCSTSGSAFRPQRISRTCSPASRTSCSTRTSPSRTPTASGRWCLPSPAASTSSTPRTDPATSSWGTWCLRWTSSTRRRVRPSKG